MTQRTTIAARKRNRQKVFGAFRQFNVQFDQQFITPTPKPLTFDERVKASAENRARIKTEKVLRRLEAHTATKVSL